jgi:hypothetical protein
MKKYFSLLVFSIAVLMLSSTASAVSINFESFSDGQNIAGVNLGGVTLTAPDNGNNVEIFDDRFGVGSHSPTKAIGTFMSGTATSTRLVGTFDPGVTFMSLWGGDGGNDDDSWSLKLYDAKVGGNLIVTLISPVTNGNPYTQLGFQVGPGGPNILRFEAEFTGPSTAGIGWDDLEFRPVPEPSTVILMAAGLLGLGFMRRRSRKA